MYFGPSSVSCFNLRSKPSLPTHKVMKAKRNLVLDEEAVRGVNYGAIDATVAQNPNSSAGSPSSVASATVCPT